MRQVCWGCSVLPKILCLDGSLGAGSGNSSVLLREMKQLLEGKASLREISLVSGPATPEDLSWASGFVFTTGTYWDSWGSPLQRFLEETTGTEATDCWMGKPAAVLVTMHSVGGKGVLSRLQGVLNTLGCLIPPMSGLVYSLAGDLALRADSEFAGDFWQREDLQSVAHNLLQALGPSPNWAAWPVDRADPKRRWLAD
jgi:NAD(P)H-dependent FMN reductase